MTLRRAVVLVFVPPVLAILVALGAWAFAFNQTTLADAAQVQLQQALDRRPEDPVVQATEILVPGSTAGLAASALQAQVLALVAGTAVQQIEARGAVAEGALTRLTLNLRLSGDEAAVMQAVLALEQAEPLIFVDALRITARTDGGGLGVEMDLAAYAGKVVP